VQTVCRPADVGMTAMGNARSDNLCTSATVENDNNVAPLPAPGTGREGTYGRENIRQFRTRTKAGGLFVVVSLR